MPKLVLYAFILCFSYSSFSVIASKQKRCVNKKGKNVLEGSVEDHMACIGGQWLSLEKKISPNKLISHLSRQEEKMDIVCGILGQAIIRYRIKGEKKATETKIFVRSINNAVNILCPVEYITKTRFRPFPRKKRK